MLQRQQRALLPVSRSSLRLGLVRASLRRELEQMQKVRKRELK